MPVTLPGKEKIIDGIRMYVSDTGRQYIADQWDAMYLPTHSIRINNNKKNVHPNPNKKNAWMKDRKSY
jgi:hypothetical protein